MKLKYLVLALLPLSGLVSCNKVKGDIEFDFTAVRKYSGTNKLSFVLVPSSEILSPKGNYHIDVIWGDGKSDTFTKEDLDMEEFVFACSHNYEQAKDYRVKIVGTISGISFAEAQFDSSQKVIEYTTMFSDDNINIDNFVVNSFSRLASATDYSDIVLGGVTSTGAISKMSNVTINYPISFFSGFTFDKTSLKTVTLPSSLMRITNSDFAGLETLETINLPNDSKITAIDDGAFLNCSSLKSFTVPSYVYELSGKSEEEVGVFTGCTSLKTIKFLSTTPTIITSTTFDPSYIPEKIIVPKGYKNAYITEWTDRKVPEKVIAKIVEE